MHEGWKNGEEMQMQYKEVDKQADKPSVNVEVVQIFQTVKGNVEDLNVDEILKNTSKEDKVISDIL